MNKTFALTTIPCSPSSSNRAFDIASALRSFIDEETYTHIYGQIKLPQTTLYCPATPSELGSGDVASNFRFKHEKEENEKVIDRWLQVFKVYSKNESKNPVVVTSVSRTGRYITFKFRDSGEVDVVNNQTNEQLSTETEIMKGFFEGFGITTEHMKVIRMATEGARFNSYFADVIGTLNMVNWKFHPEMFQEEHLGPYKVGPGSKFYRAEVAGQLMLQPVEIDGKVWTPIEGHSYMYFKKNPSFPGGSLVFKMIDEQSMPKVYSQMFEALNNQENGTKEMVRKFFLDHHDFTRFSDFWENDVDDAFAILMIINCFKYCSLSDEESLIKNKFEEIAKPWFDELSI